MRSPTKLGRMLLLSLVPASLTALLVAPAMLSGRYEQTPSSNRMKATTPAPDTQLLEKYGQIPLSFEANRGQTESSVNFLARGAGYTLFLKPDEAVFALTRGQGGASAKGRTQEHTDNVLMPTASAGIKPLPAAPLPTTVLRMKLVGADTSARVEGIDELAGKVNYFKGNDPAGRQTDVPTYGRVRYSEVYPGIDLVYYGNRKQLEYDFVIAPGRDARAVSLQFDGADKVEVNESGDLLLTLGEDIVRQPRPFVYQEVAGARQAVEGGYVVGDGGRVGFALGNYDTQLPLVIDPVLVYSTYLGGSGGDVGLAVAVDSSGSAYVSGFTTSTDFPTANPVQAAHGGGFQDAFVTKFNAAGTALVYSTYLGGNAVEQSRGIAVDSAGNAYVVGQTNSPNFPTANALQAVKGGNGEDVFITKLNPTGSALIYSTYLGGHDPEFGESITLDSSGNVYVTGTTFSTDFPTLNPFQTTKTGSTEAFITKINNTGSALIYSTLLGGNGSDIGQDITVDSAGHAYVTGNTTSTNFPTLNAIQATNGGGTSLQDAFVTKLSTTGSALVYSTYLGGTEEDGGEGIAVDSAGNAHIGGFTFSTNFPTANAIQGANGGNINQDGFVTKLHSSGSSFVYSTYLGGLGGEIVYGIAVDSAGNTYLSGATGSTTTFPTANAIQCTRAGGSDVIVTKLNATGSAFFYSTYLGGNDNDEGRDLAIDSSGNAYVAGSTRSTNYPVVNAIQSAFGGEAGIGGDALLTKVADTSTLPATTLQFSQATYNVNEDLTALNLTVQRTGDTSAPVTVNYSSADGTASERSDYTTALGTLRFAAGETSKTVTVLINEDSRTEGAESFTVALTNPTGGASIGCAAGTATIQIADDASEPSTNVIDDPSIFVGQHYHDFLNRQSDPAGQAFWENQISSCGNNATCINERRQNVSVAFFLSIEFQQTGYLVFRFYKETFTNSAQRPRGMPRYREFLRDTQEIGRGVVVGVGNWEQQLETNKQEFARRWVQTPEFVAQFPENMSAGPFVDKLFQNSEVTPTPAERNAAIVAFGAGGIDGRAAALRNVADSASVYNRQYNAAFVLMQYIGYLRRNPNDAPEVNLDYAGFDYWLNKLNSFSLPGEDVRNEEVARARALRAEMARAFIISMEYRQRFGQQ